jgi:hypothetical protein
MQSAILKIVCNFSVVQDQERLDRSIGMLRH